MPRTSQAKAKPKSKPKKKQEREKQSILAMSIGGYQEGFRFLKGKLKGDPKK